MGPLYCLGDSLTFGLGVRHQERWTSLAELASNCSIVNLGVSGDTTAGMLVRLRLDILPRHAVSSVGHGRPFVLLLGGSNDIFYSGSLAGAKANMGAMIHQTRSAGLTPVVGLPLPIAPERIPAQWTEVTNFHAASDLLQEYSAWLKTFCAAFSVQTLDFQADFYAPDGSVRTDLFLDGLHPNPEGHRKMAQKVISFLNHQNKVSV